MGEEIAVERVEAPGRVTTSGITDGGFLRRLVHGLRFPLEGLRYLGKNPGLLKYALPPAICLVAILSVVYWHVPGWSGALVDWLWSDPGGDAWYYRWILRPFWHVFYAVVFVLVLIVGTLGSYIASMPIAGPFNELLSEKVEFLETGFDAPFSLAVMFRNMLVTVVHLVLFSSIQLTLLVTVQLLNLIPVVGPVVVGGIAFLTSPLIVGYAPFDYPMTLRLWTFREKMGFLRKNYAFFEGFSLTSFVLLYVPLVNVLFLPVCVVASTLAVVRMEQSGELQLRDRRKEILEASAARKAKKLKP